MIDYNDFDLSKCFLPISQREAEVMLDCLVIAAGEGFFGIDIERYKDEETNGESKKNREALNSLCHMLGLSSEYLGDGIVEYLTGCQDEKDPFKLNDSPIKKGTNIMDIIGTK